MQLRHGRCLSGMNIHPLGGVSNVWRCILYDVGFHRTRVRGPRMPPMFTLLLLRLVLLIHLQFWRKEVMCRLSVGPRLASDPRTLNDKCT